MSDKVPMTKVFQVRMRPDLRDAIQERAEELQVRPSQLGRLALALACAPKQLETEHDEE